MDGNRLQHHTFSAGSKAVQKNEFISSQGLVDRLPTRTQRKAARNAEIRERHANGETRKALSVEYRLSESRIDFICQGIKPKEQRNAEIRERFANGEMQKVLAQHYGISIGSVHIICKGVERKAKPKHRPSQAKEARNANIRKRWAEGVELRLIAAVFDLNKSTIRNICKGVERKRGNPYV
jgi:Mor family transcriptional regulator